jgi:hypothetical protein
MFYVWPSSFILLHLKEGYGPTNCEAMVLKGAEKVKTKKNTGDRRQKTGERQRQEEWNGGRIIRRVLDS